MARPVNQVRWDQWRQLLARQRESGLSVAEFCRKEDISRQGFHAWKRKLFSAKPTRRASGKACGAQRPRQRRGIAKPRARALQTRAHPALPRPAEFLQLPLTTTAGSPWIELALADGTILRLPQQNLAALVATLRVLRGERLEVCWGERGHA